MTKYKFGVIGHNISYSQSPKIFNTIFKLRQIDGGFTIYDFPENEFENNLPRLRDLDGFSVTIPYKERIIKSIDDICDSARTIKSVNSVKVENSRLVGSNTDGIGFLYGLNDIENKLKNVLILGSGGAARAVIRALIEHYNIKSIAVCGRKYLDSEKLKEQYFSYVKSDIDFTYSTIFQINRSAKYDLIVNCTPCGDSNHLNESPLPEDFEFTGCGICYDLIYNPAKTLLLTKAEESGWRAINGYRMLIRQAVESYRIWSGDNISADKLTQDILTSEEK
jgi:shikimate dehydrogenase